MILSQPHGWLVLDKPRGLGSTQAVAAVKRALRPFRIASSTSLRKVAEAPPR